MDIQEKLQFMLEQQILGGIELKDAPSFIATVDDIHGRQITFLDHSPDQTNPLITASIDEISAIHVPEPGCGAEE